MTRNSTAIIPKDIHKQVIKKKIGKLNSKDKPKEQKQRGAPGDFVCTPLIEHLFTQTSSFYCGFDRYKFMDCFQVQLVN